MGIDINHKSDYHDFVITFHLKGFSKKSRVRSNETLYVCFRYTSTWFLRKTCTLRRLSTFICSTIFTLHSFSKLTSFQNVEYQFIFVVMGQLSSYLKQRPHLI